VLLLAPCLVIIIIIIIIIISQGVTEVIGKSDTRVSSRQLAAANDVHDDEDTSPLLALLFSVFQLIDEHTNSLFAAT